MKGIIQEGSQEKKGVEGNVSQCQEVGEWKNVTQKGVCVGGEATLVNVTIFP
jgi:hypothetical protein